jgi:hypothetical protein
MPNLYTGNLDVTEFKTITELTGITFTPNTEYSIEIKGDCVVREGTVGLGNLIEGKERILFKAGDSDLYLGPNGVNHTVRINIAS